MMISTAITTIIENKKKRLLADGSRFGVMFGILETDLLNLDDLSRSVVWFNKSTKMKGKFYLGFVIIIDIVL